MHYGVPGVPFHKWHQWRDPAPHPVDQFDEMKCGVFGLLDRANLLDLLRHFIVFETEDGKTVKKVARYQQFRGANKLVARALQLGKPTAWRRRRASVASATSSSAVTSRSSSCFDRIHP